jgi:hypothetical protein
LFDLSPLILTARGVRKETPNGQIRYFANYQTKVKPNESAD